MCELVEKLSEVRCKSKPEIETFWRTISDHFSNYKKLEGKLTDLLDEVGLPVVDKRLVFDSVFMALILARIGEFYSPYVRQDKVKGIQQICMANKVNFPYVLHLTAYASQLENLIAECRN